MGTGKEIRRLRLKYRLSAEKAAAAIGVDASRLRKWEQKDLEPKAEDARTIENFFGVPLTELANLEYVNFFQNVPEANEADVPFRRTPKTETDPEKEGITFIPISAQAGYARRVSEPVFMKQLEKLYIPGFPYRGDRYRIFEVEGNSMEPTFKEHFHVLTEKVEQEGWSQIKEFYTYVVVTQDDVLLKRIKRSKQPNHWVLISDNSIYEPFLIPIEIVTELWLVKRKMDWEMSPPKRFEIDL